MDAGTLNRKISIQRPSTTVDAIGQPVQGWTEVASVWADIRHQTGMEATKADAPVSTVRASVRIRYRTGLDAGMRVVHGDTVYSIKAVLPDAQYRAHVDLVCEVVR